MDKNFKPVYVRGTETGTGVIEALEALGGINNCHYRGTDCDSIYFILPDNHIIATPINSAYAKYIMATARELKSLRWRAERGSAYYSIDSCMTIIKMSDYDDIFDNGRYECGNYFKTKEEAEIAAEKIKKILLPD